MFFPHPETCGLGVIRLPQAEWNADRIECAVQLDSIDCVARQITLCASTMGHQHHHHHGGGHRHHRGSNHRHGEGSRSGGSGKFKGALTEYASTKDPQTIPRDVLLCYDQWTLAIFDKFEKAKFHMLVLPRMPFALPEEPDATPSADKKDTSNAPSSSAGADGDEPQAKRPKLGLSGGKLTFGTSTGKHVPNSHLESIRTLLASPHAAYVFDKMHKMALKVRHPAAARK